MRCDACGREEATVLIGGGPEGRRRLCASCARASGVSGSGAGLRVDLGALLGSLSRDPAVDGPRCPDCGLTLDESRRLGRLGCPACAREFLPYHPRLRSRPAYRGEAPAGSPGC